MIVPQGMTFNIGLREYSGGMELPANAPQSVVKQCTEYAAELEKKKKEAEKPVNPKPSQPPQGGGGE